jgi:hypothetical protein
MSRSIGAGHVFSCYCALVIAGLDPAIHLSGLSQSFLMDARVKPAHDDLDT